MPHAFALTLLIVALAAGGNKLVTAGKKGSVFPRVLDVETGKSVLELDGHTDLSPAGSWPVNHVTAIDHNNAADLAKHLLR
jgi:hypothetical protein